VRRMSHPPLQYPDVGGTRPGDHLSASTTDRPETGKVNHRTVARPSSTPSRGVEDAAVCDRYIESIRQSTGWLRVSP